MQQATYEDVKAGMWKLASLQLINSYRTSLISQRTWGVKVNVWSGNGSEWSETLAFDH